MQSIRELVSQIIDYAGLFPPASLSMNQVVENYARYRDDSFSWMLARLIVPASRLNEFEKVAKIARDGHQPWCLSALIPALDSDANGFAEALRAIAEFNERHRVPTGGLAIIDTVEVNAGTEELIEATARGIPANINAFLELPYKDDPQPLIDVIRRCESNIFAKIRTGGVTSELIPSPTEVARFIHRCSQSKVGFKATAGLHHPIRGDFRLTYDDDAQTGTMYGFLNVFVAACFAFDGMGDQPALEQILIATDATEFEIQPDALSWRGHKVSVDAIARIRRNYAVSFGSCSFVEPTQELEQLGMLADLTTS